MKHIIILGDGMADWPAESLGNKTLLQYSSTPYMDKLAAMGRTGRLVTVAPGFHPGSEVANMSVMGYNLPKVYEGRGPLEAASIGVELQPGDMAMRCNIICIEDEKIKNHSAGHITTEEADVLVRYLEEKLGSDRIHFYTGVQYRHLLVIKGGNKQLDCTPPHDVPLQPFRPLMVKAEVPEAQETAGLINNLIPGFPELLLADHPVNQKRQLKAKILLIVSALESGVSPADGTSPGKVSGHKERGCFSGGLNQWHRHYDYVLQRGLPVFI